MYLHELSYETLISHVSLAIHAYSKRRQEYKYTIEQSTEYTSLMIRQHVGGGKSYYDPKTEVDVWENYTTNDTTEMDDIVTEILDKKKKTPVIVTIECELGDEVNPNLYYLYLAFPPTSSSNSSEGDTSDVSTPPSPKMYRRVRVPLVLFCEKLATAFEKQMTSTALCFVADASSSLGSDMLTNVVKECDHGVVSFVFYSIVVCYLGYVSYRYPLTSYLFHTTHASGNNLQPCLDDMSILHSTQK